MPHVLRARCESTSKPRLATRHRPEAAGAAFDKGRCNRPGSSHDDPFGSGPRPRHVPMKNCSALEKVRHRLWLHLSRWRGKSDTNRVPTDQRLRACFGCTGCANTRRAWVFTHRLGARSPSFPRHGSRRTSSNGRPALTDFPGFTSRAGRLPDGKRLAFERAGRKPGNERTTNLLRSHPHHGHLVHTATSPRSVRRRACIRGVFGCGGGARAPVPGRRADAALPGLDPQIEYRRRTPHVAQRPGRHPRIRVARRLRSCADAATHQPVGLPA